MLKGRLIIDPFLSGIENMGVDEALFDRAGSDGSFPVTLRLYGWTPPTVSIGRRQGIEKVNSLACKARGVEIVKRFGGGSAVYHDEEITYCFVTRLDVIPLPSTDKWRKIFALLLKKLGLTPEPFHGKAGEARTTCFASAEEDEPTIDGKKWVGSARRKSKAVFLQHGSILLKSQPHFLKELIKNSDADSSIGLLELLPPKIDAQTIANAFIKSVEEVFGLSFSSD